MTTKVYLAINGTNTAHPDENLFEKLRMIERGEIKREYADSLGRYASVGQLRCG